MQIVVTAGATPLGQALLRAIVARGALVRGGGAPVAVQRIIAVDRRQPASLFVHPLVEYVCGNFEQPRFLARMMGTATDSVFHLGALYAAVPGTQFDDLELALLYSLDTTRALVDACQYQSAQPRLVLASTVAVHHAPDAAPAGTDGICAALCEHYLVECARRGLVDLRSVRLPGIAGHAQADAPAALAQPGDEVEAAAPGGAPAAVAPGVLADAAEALLAAHELARPFPVGVQLLDVPPGPLAHAGAPAVGPRGAAPRE